MDDHSFLAGRHFLLARAHHLACILWPCHNGAIQTAGNVLCH